MNTRSDRAARRFFNELLPGESWDYTGHPAKPLIAGAFALYQKAWGKDFNPERWEWPLNELKAGHAFEGDEPWTVLLRHAVKLARKRRGGKR